MKLIDELVDDLTLAEQISLLSGEDFWSLPAIERLGIGKLRVTDGPNGARGSGDWFGGVSAAAFPVGIALGSTWDPTLVYEIAVALAQETRSKSAHVLLAPTVNIHRSVTNGRNFECYSEDPELSAALTVACVKGLQENGIAATIKHFAGNESEIQRTTMNSQIDEQSLREIYLRPFEAGIKEGGAWAIMTSYNRMNGLYNSENEWLLKKILRGEWRFDGVVMSDWFGSHSTAPTVNAGLDIEMPGPTRDRGDKLIAAVEAGDVSRETIRARALNILRLMERTGALQDKGPFEEKAEDRPEHRALIRRAGAAGAVLLKNEGVLPLAQPEARIAVIGPNAATAQIMGGGSSQINAHYRVSPLEAIQTRFGTDAVIHAPGCTNHRWEPVCTTDVGVDFFDNCELAGQPVAQQRLRESQTFWTTDIADNKVEPGKFSARAQWQFTPATGGTHRFGLHVAGLGRLFVDGELVVDAHEGWTRGRTFFEEGCDEIVAERELKAGQCYDISIEIVAKPGDMMAFTAFRAGIGLPLGDADIKAAVQAAKAAETAIVFAGRSGEWDTEGSDLEHIRLPGRQDELIASVLAANPRTVIVLQTGGPVEMPWLDQAPAVLQAWYGGQETGNAIADILFGEAEPGGRLSQTFPKKWADNPTFSEDPQVYPGKDGTVRYDEGLFIGYRHYDRAGIEPLFAFGHGLTFTDFAIGNLVAEPATSGGAQVSLTIRNTGQRTGTTVVQLYAGRKKLLDDRPKRQLVGFVKCKLAVGEDKRLAFDLPARAFARYDIKRGAWVVDAGDIRIEAGFSVVDIREDRVITIDEKALTDN